MSEPNDNIEDIFTVVKPDRLLWYLNRFQYDPVETQFLYSGFTKGFHLGYAGPCDRVVEANNQGHILLSTENAEFCVLL